MPIQPCTFESKVKGKQDHSTRSDLVAHSAQDLQTLLSQFSSPCSDFGYTFNFEKLKS